MTVARNFTKILVHRRCFPVEFLIFFSRTPNGCNWNYSNRVYLNWIYELFNMNISSTSLATFIFLRWARYYCTLTKEVELHVFYGCFFSFFQRYSILWSFGSNQAEKFGWNNSFCWNELFLYTTKLRLKCNCLKTNHRACNKKEIPVK